MATSSGSGSGISSRLGTYNRRPSHAGSWYSSDPRELSRDLEKWLDDVHASTSRASSSADTKIQKASGAVVDNRGTSGTHCRGLICPHAGYSFSGPTAAYSYAELYKCLLVNKDIKRIVVLHPSHHVYLKNVALSGARNIETVLGVMPVDLDFMNQLVSLDKDGKFFTVMDQRTDETEHSGEMQYPFIRHCCLKAGRQDMYVCPMMVGATHPQLDMACGEALSVLLKDKQNFFIISTDFCHWGERFDYQPFAQNAKNHGRIAEFIKDLDLEGVGLICSQDPHKWLTYLNRTKNTICGRHPITLFMFMMQNSGRDKNEYEVRHLQYSQSEAVTSVNQSSVSYVSMVVENKTQIINDFSEFDEDGEVWASEEL